jgi:hypothetical protein
MNETVNFEVKSDALAVIQSLDIEANFEEMRVYLSEMMEPYMSLKVTDVAAAKSARAYCNRVEKSLEDSRRMVKKLYQQPLAEFENKVKALTAICKSASVAIDTQIKEIENAEKEAKLAEIREYFLEASADIEAYITWERIYNPKWENKTCDPVKCKADIDEAVQIVKEDIQVIRAMHSPYETMLLAVYARSGSMQEVLTQKTVCEKLESTSTVDDTYVNGQASTETRAGDSEIEPISHESTKEVKLYTFTLEFTTTREKAFLVQSFFEQNQIQYRKVANVK